MQLIKEHYIHNKLTLTNLEQQTLSTASSIIASIREQNIHSAGSEDTYLNELCTVTITNIAELLHNYRNEYLNTQE